MTPKTLKISGHTYDVIIRERSKKDGVNQFGTCDSQYNRIYIESDLSDSQKESTLLHEIIEAINYLNELELDHKTITVLENNLYQVLKDNKILCSNQLKKLTRNVAKI